MDQLEHIENSTNEILPVQLVGNRTVRYNDKSITTLMDLPNEILVNILNRVPVQDTIQFRNISQRFLAIIDGNDLVNKNLLTSLSSPRVSYIANTISESDKKMVDNIFLSADNSVLAVTYQYRFNYSNMADYSPPIADVLNLINNQWKIQTTLFEPIEATIQKVIFSFDNRYMVTISNWSIQLWAKKDDNWEIKNKVHKSIFRVSVKFRKDSHRLFIKCYHSILIYSLENNEYVPLLKYSNSVIHDFDINTATFTNALSTLNNDKWLTALIHKHCIFAICKVTLEISNVQNMLKILTSKVIDNVYTTAAYEEYFDNLYNKAEVKLICFSNDNKLVVIQPGDELAIMLENTTNGLVEKTRFIAEANKMKFSADNTRILGVYNYPDQRESKVIIWKIIENTVLKEYSLKSESKIYNAKFSFDNKRIIVLLADKLILCKFTNNSWKENTLINYAKEYRVFFGYSNTSIFIQYARPSYLIFQ